MFVSCSQSGQATQPRAFSFRGERFGDLVRDSAECFADEHVAGYRNCPDSSVKTIGSIPVTMFGRGELDRKLIGITFSVEFRDFERLASAFKEVYGPPDSSYSRVIDATLTPGKIGSEYRVWVFDDGALTLSRSAADYSGQMWGRVEAVDARADSAYQQKRRLAETADSARIIREAVKAIR